MQVNDKPIRDTAALISLISDLPIGKSATLKIVRNGKELNVTSLIEKAPSLDESGQVVVDTEGLADDEKSSTIQKGQVWRGLSLEELNSATSNLRHADLKGVVISKVENGSPAEDTGLRSGDIITGINQHPIESLQDFYKEINKVKGDCLIQTSRGFFVIKEK